VSVHFGVAPSCLPLCCSENSALVCVVRDTRSVVTFFAALKFGGSGSGRCVPSGHKSCAGFYTSTPATIVVLIILLET
jgi:hypothetical protein